MSRVFRVVSVLNYEDLHKCFSFSGGLKKVVKTRRHTSFKSASEEAHRAADNGWRAFVVRRTRTGWQTVWYWTPAE